MALVPVAVEGVEAVLAATEVIEELFTAGYAAPPPPPTIVRWFIDMAELSRISVTALAATVYEKISRNGPQKITPTRRDLVSYIRSHPLSMAQPKKSKKKAPGKAKQPSMVAVAQPAAKSMVLRAEQPSFRTMPNGTIRATHKEYVCDFVGGGTSTPYSLVKAFQIDPAEPQTFPWLSGIAVQYEQFRFHKLKIHYVTEQSTSAAGGILISYDPNGARLVPTSKVQQLEISGTMRGPVWQSSSLNFDVDSSLKYCAAYNNYGPTQGFTVTTYTGQAISAQDLRSVTAGVIYVATSNVSSSVSGELWLEYEVELRAPTLAFPPATIARVLLGSTANTSFAWNDFIGLTQCAPNLHLSGTISMQMGAAGGGNGMSFIPAGNCTLIYTMPTSTTSGSNTLTITSSPTGIASTLIMSSMTTTSFTCGYALTNVPPGGTVTIVQNGSWTNLSFSVTNPGKLYILPYDSLVNQTTVL